MQVIHQVKRSLLNVSNGQRTTEEGRVWTKNMDVEILRMEQLSSRINSF